MTPKVQAALDQLIQAIREETVASFSAMLAGGGTSTGLTARRSARPARKSSGGKRTTEELGAFKTTLLAFIKKNPGLRTEQIAKEIGVTTKELQPRFRSIAKRWSGAPRSVIAKRAGI